MNLTPDVDKFIPYSTLEWMDRCQMWTDSPRTSSGLHRYLSRLELTFTSYIDKYVDIW